MSEKRDDSKAQKPLATDDNTVPTSISGVLDAEHGFDVLEGPTEPGYVPASPVSAEAPGGDTGLVAPAVPGLEPASTVAIEPVSVSVERPLRPRLVRLPTESEIRAAVDATPTDKLPVVTRPKT